MPTLPTITVSDAQAARIIAAYGGTVPKYLEWLTRGVVDFVIRKEVEDVTVANAIVLNAAIAAIKADLPAVSE